MSAVGDPAADTDAESRAEGPRLAASLEMAVRLVVGWCCALIGVFNLIVELDRWPGATDVPYLIFHAVLLVGGGALLGLGWLAPRPGRSGYLAGGAVLVLGMVVSSAPATTTVCCLPAFTVRHGYPFIFAARDSRDRWHIDSLHLFADLMFWGYAGLLVLILITVLRRAARHTESAEKTVGPLP